MACASLLLSPLQNHFLFDWAYAQACEEDSMFNNPLEPKTGSSDPQELATCYHTCKMKVTAAVAILTMLAMASTVSASPGKQSCNNNDSHLTHRLIPPVPP
jgi:hypothetical protein